MWPTEDSTTNSGPKRAPIVRALAGDSTITRGLAAPVTPVEVDRVALGMVR